MRSNEMLKSVPFSRYNEMLKSDDNYDKVLINALYHRYVWRKDNKTQGQVVMRDICRKVLDGVDRGDFCRDTSIFFVHQYLLQYRR